MIQKVGGKVKNKNDMMIWVIYNWNETSQNPMIIPMIDSYFDEIEWDEAIVSRNIVKHFLSYENIIFVGFCHGNKSEEFSWYFYEKVSLKIIIA